ncbi:MAG: Zn-ribbon containing protein [archaeon]
MAYQCVKCGQFCNQEEIRKGCECGGRVFLYVRGEAQTEELIVSIEDN